MLRSLVLFLTLSASAMAQELKVVVPSNSDSYSINARIFTRHMAKYLPEKPSVVIQEVPGAYSVVAANYLYELAPRDGNTIGTFYKNIPLMGAMGGTSIKYDARKFTWLGSTADGREDAVILWSNKPGPVDRYRSEELVVGSENIVAGDPTILVRDLLGIKMKLVAGYANSSTARLALERKEIDAAVYSLIGIKTAKPDWLKPESDIKAILQFGNGTTRHKDYQNVPTLAEYINRKELLEVYEKQFILLRPFVAPPNIPLARARELRHAFEFAIKDEEFLTEAKKANIDVKMIHWQEAERIVDETVGASHAILETIRNMK
jgi:tripartite-type tricarboxylate transporter receptor subunit TctC